MSVLTVRTKTEDMTIGDIIPCRYKASLGAPGVFSELGTCTASEIPVTGTATPDGKFNFVKVDKGLLIADRVVQTSISWDTLNAAKYIQGCPRIRLPMDFSVKSNNGTYSVLTCYPSNPITLTYNVQYHGGGYVSILASDILPNIGSCKIKFNFKTINHYSSAWGYVIQILAKSKLSSNRDISYNYSKEYIYSSNVTQGGIDALLEFTVSTNNTYELKVNNIVVSSGSCDSNDICIQVGSGEYGGQYSVVLSNIEVDTKDNNDISLQSNYTKPTKLIRSLSGGSAYLGTDGGVSLTDKGLGAWPVNNEWDKYIVSSDLGGKVTPGDDAVWHLKDTVTAWCQDTPLNGHISINGTAISSWRTIRGDHDTVPGDVKSMYGSVSSIANRYMGFRPVLEYPEDVKCTNVWY